MEFDFDLENPFSTSINNFPLLFRTENDHIPSKSYLQTAKSNRSQTASLIQCLCRNFDVYSSYLAINYMDRFFSATSIPEEKPWIWRLIAVSCTSLALKMRKIDFSLSEFQDEVGMAVDSVTVERTEMLILGALKWRMRSVNPFSFMSFFIPFLGIEDESSIQELKDRATHHILRAQSEMKLLGFKPSVICAAALVSAANEVLPSQLPRFRNSVSCCEYVSKAEIFNCYDIMQEESSRRDSSLFYAASASPRNSSQCSSSSNSENNLMSKINISVDEEIRVLKRPRSGEMSGI